MTTTQQRTAGARRPRRGEPRRNTPRVLVLPETMTVKELAELLDQSPVDVIKQLMRHGIMVSVNQVIDHQVATVAAAAYSVRTRLAEVAEDTSAINAGAAEDDEDLLESRPPVITILGHVDHGKTSLLDYIRSTAVVEKEAGGITQHIGAYQVSQDGQPITFLDTPGHAAFTAIRSRGARVTDIAVLVVAADDGIMPQTDEAIDHARAAEVPIVVAINKMDLPSAQPDVVKRQLSERNLLVEEWGGDIIAVPVSAQTGDGVDDLIENLLVLSEILELKANPGRDAAGVIIEATLDRRRGPSATVLVQTGTLKVGDHIVAGGAWGRVRAITNERGETMEAITPGSPGVVTGLNATPEAGDILRVVSNERTARQTATRHGQRGSTGNLDTVLTLDNIVKQIDAGDVKELVLVLKADVQGSVEAAVNSIEKLSDGDVKARIIHAGSGLVSDSDVQLASASGGIILAFNVGFEIGAERTAERLGVEVRNYQIIYRLLEDVEQALHGMLEPEYEEVVVGRAEVREIFAGRRGVQIAGCRVLDGRITRQGSVRVMREDDILVETEMSSLRHFRDEVNQATAGTDCGIVLESFNNYEEGDVILAYRMERVN
ncbi:MAG: translation initiation factor IF-2 [Chloroflexota bacterium]|nr:translation initiation factor IF-2 [Chloroflexota bacterium]MDE2683829.1 translation initiation factor IF-2 [Chloroflexota bacterium]